MKLPKLIRNWLAAQWRLRKCMSLFQWWTFQSFSLDELLRIYANVRQRPLVQADLARSRPSMSSAAARGGVTGG